MTDLLLTLVLLGAAAALLSAFGALRAWLGFRRARGELQGRLLEEVSALAGRAGELERSLGELEERAARLPVRLSELQESLSTLRLLSGALAASLRQLRRALSPSGLKAGASGYLSALAGRAVNRRAG
ncbi:hypothetical protein Rxyl_2189 [Rubrobacter xylanophilus DSM 9941]|uniref:Uncharacterized protein n=1 Tax=Rubrobacter xylanophilus (strain DSM 9941 / JCM 11954 / NBRC 16129 / PRD-1) TaxID=266117 RepID=Q1ATZ5_RUBXD|nr:hypothetical protein [Rubrobacter xylanophilus]ABG05133.1 hypothetical protein Rxyl_2189 [Rubrobacter xylanophilus DSM 9941]